MHIQERTNTILTTCSKMTEEVDRRHVVNGKGVHEEPEAHNTTASGGGRLKFFKDGKFILELARAKEGEKVGWVSVPRKTFWPPPAAATPVTSNPSTPNAHSHRNERATSLSVSDDNSSLQSSPWQRDHCWKQSTPRKNVSKELTLFYCRPADLPNAIIAVGSKLKRKKPFEPSVLNRKTGLCNGSVLDGKRNGLADCGDDSVDGLDREREMYHRMKLKKPHQYRRLRVYRKTKTVLLKKRLNETVDKLREKIASIPPPVNNKISSLNCRQEHTMVSPRKRILRELERVSLEDQANKRRARAAPSLCTASYPSPSPSSIPASSPATLPSSPVPAPGPSQRPSPQLVRPTPVMSKNVSSYSIHSLLSIKEEPRHTPPDIRKVEMMDPVPNHAHSPAPIEGSDAMRYRYHPPFSPYARGFYPAPQRVREDYVYGYGGGYVGTLFRPSPWIQYAPPGPWTPIHHPIVNEHIKEEPSSDLPLNLSKH